MRYICKGISQPSITVQHTAWRAKMASGKEVLQIVVGK